MRTLESAADADHPMIVEDSAGHGFQYLPDTAVPREIDGDNMWIHTIAGGWWDLSMTNRAEDHIQFPATIVWEG